jgi:hypothetical protein
MFVRTRRREHPRDALQHHEQKNSPEHYLVPAPLFKHALVTVMIA